MPARVDMNVTPGEIEFTGEDVIAMTDHPGGMLFTVATEKGPEEVSISFSQIKDILLGGHFFGDFSTGDFRVTKASLIQEPF